jgi:hypothetical protein
MVSTTLGWSKLFALKTCIKNMKLAGITTIQGASGCYLQKMNALPLIINYVIAS